MMKKRIVSIILALSLCMGLSVPAFAADSNQSIERVTSAQIEAEVQAEKERIFDSVYRQLEEQSALSMYDIYKAELSPMIETSVRARYNVENVTQGATPRTISHHYFPYGGIVSYSSKVTGADVLTVYMDYDTTYHYILTGSFTALDVIETALSYVPVIGNSFSLLSTVRTIANEVAKRDIAAAGGYGYILNITDPMSGIEPSILLGWDNYPYGNSNADTQTNIKTVFFPDTNPWG